MAAKHSTLRLALLPRRAVLRIALTVMVTLVVGLAPGLAQNRAAAVSPHRGYLNFANQTDTTEPAGYFPPAGRAGLSSNFPWTGASRVTVKESAAMEEVAAKIMDDRTSAEARGRK